MTLIYNQPINIPTKNRKIESINVIIFQVPLEGIFRYIGSTSPEKIELQVLSSGNSLNPTTYNSHFESIIINSKIHYISDNIILNKTNLVSEDDIIYKPRKNYFEIFYPKPSNNYSHWFKYKDNLIRINLEYSVQFTCELRKFSYLIKNENFDNFRKEKTPFQVAQIITKLMMNNQTIMIEQKEFLLYRDANKFIIPISGKITLNGFEEYKNTIKLRILAKYHNPDMEKNFGYILLDGERLYVLDTITLKKIKDSTYGINDKYFTIPYVNTFDNISYFIEYDKLLTQIEFSTDNIKDISEFNNIQPIQNNIQPILPNTSKIIEKIIGELNVDNKKHNIENNYQPVQQNNIQPINKEDNPKKRNIENNDQPAKRRIVENNMLDEIIKMRDNKFDNICGDIIDHIRTLHESGHLNYDNPNNVNEIQKLILSNKIEEMYELSKKTLANYTK